MDNISIILQMLLIIVVISMGIFLKLNLLQWVFVIFLSSALLMTGIYRGAAHLLASYDDSISFDQAVRIKAMSNIVAVITTGFTFFSFLIVFVPRIYQLV